MRRRPGSSRAGAACWALLALPAAAGAAPFVDIFIFGDSFSDTGNVYATTFTIYPPDPPYYQGRFSDGPVWVEYTADELGLLVFANGRNPWLIVGNNFAFGGARAGVDVPFWPLGTIPSVRTQTDAFIAGVAPLSADALYIVYCGGNDVLYAADPANGFTPPEQDQIIRMAVDDVLLSIANLADAGADRFLMPNGGDAGITPAARFVDNNAAVVTALTSQFNELLEPALRLFASTRNVVIVQVDAFGLTHQIFDDAVNNGGAVFGITNVDVPIFPGYAGSPGADPDTSMFADDLHPSTLVHAIFADASLTAIERSVPFFADCLNGPDTPARAGCDLVDFDDDRDVDLADFGAFQEQFTDPWP
jgi:phospholipase/lecithinase/hemolysin